MDISNFFLAYGQIVAVSIIPVALWFLGVNYQNRKTKRDTKLKLFLTLIANRKYSPLTKEYIHALNQVDVVFQDDLKVRQSWRDYIESLDSQSQHFKEHSSFQQELLIEMGNVLGYKNLKSTDLERFYYFPQSAVDANNLDTMIKGELVRVLGRSKSLAESYTEEEYNERVGDVS